MIEINDIFHQLRLPLNTVKFLLIVLNASRNEHRDYVSTNHPECDIDRFMHRALRGKQSPALKDLLSCISNCRDSFDTDEHFNMFL